MTPSTVEPAPHARRTLFLLWCVFAVAQLDRNILSFALEPIALEFGLTDTQLGLLTGFAFAAVFVLVGFPVAALCLTRSRHAIVSVSVFAWSALTLASAGAQGFAHLLVARLGIGAAEAGAVAPAHSMISDLYPEDRHASSLSAFASGANFGVLLAALIGGVVGQMLGWRWAFAGAGLLGLIVALAFARLAVEPARAVHGDPDARDALLSQTLRTLLSQRGTRRALIAFLLMGALVIGTGVWVPTVFVRQYGLTLSQTGAMIALVAGFVGGTGTALCGLAVDWMGRRDARYRLYVVAGTVAVAALFKMVFLLIPTPLVGIAAFVLSTFFSFAFWGPGFAFVYAQIPGHQRPMATAILLLLFNFGGMAVGATVIGALSDAFAPGAGDRALSYGILCVMLVSPVAVWLFASAASTRPAIAHQRSDRPGPVSARWSR